MKGMESSLWLYLLPSKQEILIMDQPQYPNPFKKAIENYIESLAPSITTRGGSNNCGCTKGGALLDYIQGIRIYLGTLEDQMRPSSTIN